MGSLLSIIAAFIASLKDIYSKKISYNVDGTVSAFGSFLYALPFYLLLLSVLAITGNETFNFSAAFFLYVFLRSLTDSFAELCKMHSFTHCDLSVASCLISMSLAFMLITSPLITGDEITLLGGSGVALVLIGNILLVYEPKKVEKTSSKGIVFALGAAFFFSLNSCFDRLAVQVASPAISGFGMTLLAAIMLAIPFLRLSPSKRKALTEYKKDFSIRGFFEVGFMVCKLWALQYLQAPYVAGIGKLSLILSIVGGKVIFKEKDFLKKIFCGVLIIAGAALIMYSEIQNRLL